jgi:hypothetical protein
VHDENHEIVAGATVTGVWSGIIAEGTTGGDGTVTFTRTLKGGKTTFTVTNVTDDVLPYDPGANHDPDGDSNGTSITISK